MKELAKASELIPWFNGIIPWIIGGLIGAVLILIASILFVKLRPVVKNKAVPHRNYIFGMRCFTVILVLLGLLLTMLAESQLTDHQLEFWKATTTHIGIALMVAGIVGLVIELAEFRKYFEERLSDILKGNTFLSLLSDENLEEWNLLAMKKMIKNKADNPDYKPRGFADTINQSIISNVGQNYRDNWVETIQHEVLTQDEIKALFSPKPVPPNLNKVIVRITVSIKYDLISPHKNSSTKEKTSYLWTVRRIPGLEKHKHWELWLNQEYFGPDELTTFILPEKEDDRNTLHFKKDITLAGKTPIKYKIQMYQYSDCGYYSSFLESLTHNVRINFSSDRHLNLMAETYGLKENVPDPEITKYSVNMQLNGWALPGHGYYITWSEPSVNGIQTISDQPSESITPLEPPVSDRTSATYMSPS